MTYKVDSTTKDPSVWNAQSEALIALLAVSLGRTRELNPLKVCQELNFKYLNKTGEEANISNYGATLLQRSIIKNKGY